MVPPKVRNALREHKRPGSPSARWNLACCEALAAIFSQIPGQEQQAIFYDRAANRWREAILHNHGKVRIWPLS